LFQAATNTTALVVLAAISVVGSNIEGFKILFEDRAIVRDYKSLLQIETRLMQISYFLGKQARLVAPLSNSEKLYNVVAKYQDLGLFTSASYHQGSVTYLGILSALIRMNASMKFFVSMGAPWGLGGEF
jgi:hypothetical protein